MKRSDAEHWKTRPAVNLPDTARTDRLGCIVRESALVNNFHKRKRREAAYEKNQLIRSTDNTFDVYFVYGEDGKRSHKYTWDTETLYFNNFWSYYKDGTTSFAGGKVSKHIFLGETRLATTINDYAYAVNGDHSTESDHIYYYHSDHLGSAQLVTDYRGDEYERLEYTPYGETWVNVKIQGDNERTPMSFRFSAKELDKETGFYYYGARYLDPKYSRWISADPAMNTGEYFPQAPVNDEAKKHNQNLPGMGGVFNHINANLYVYAANNPIKYTDPDGREVDDENTLKKLCKINLISESKKSIIVPETIRMLLSDRVVQAASVLQKKSEHIKDFEYIADQKQIETKIVNNLNENANNPEMLVSSITWYDEDAHVYITEYSVFNYDKETKKAVSGPIQIYVDIGDDGYIDYMQYIPFDWTNEKEKS